MDASVPSSVWNDGSGGGPGAEHNTLHTAPVEVPAARIRGPAMSPGVMDDFATSLGTGPFLRVLPRVDRCSHGSLAATSYHHFVLTPRRPRNYGIFGAVRRAEYFPPSRKSSFYGQVSVG